MRGLDEYATRLMLRQTPYVEGGRTEAGLDCLGLVLLAFRQAGIDLPDPADADGDDPFRMAAFADLFRPVSPLEAEPGDVVVFLDDEQARHVGLVVGGGRLIHTGSGTGIVRQRLARVLRRPCRILRHVGLGPKPEA